MQKRKPAEFVFAIVCVSFLLFMMCTIGIRFLTRQILVEKFGINNLFTDIVFFDNPKLNEKKDESAETVPEIHWAELYPFDEEVIEKDKLSAPEKSVFSKYSEKIKDKAAKIESLIEIYAANNLFGYDVFTASSEAYESLIGWNFVPYDEYNGIVQIGDGYLSGLTKQRNVRECADATVAFADFCSDRGIDFLYIQFPSKIGKYDEPDIADVTDFSNRNADNLLETLNSFGVNTYDLRETIRKTGFYNRELFFRTDHHWKPETGLWASRQILRELHDRFGYETDPSLLSPENFDSVLYKNWFLGSQGKKVTLAACEPDDISLLYPKFETRFHYEIPSIGIDTTGAFDVCYDMKQISEMDYYKKSPYHAYNYGDRPLIRIENRLADDDTRVLVIHDSLSDCVISFLACDFRYVDAIDLRYFTGSLESFIEEESPDVVIVKYYPFVISETVNYDTHESLFDFR